MTDTTDWSRLSHAYGPATDIPAQLARLAAEPDAELWNDLWSALCHQGSVYSASFAALPWLAAVADGEDREQSVQAALLASAIVTGENQPHGAGDVRGTYAPQIRTLLMVVTRLLPTSTELSEYAYLLAAVLTLEGGVDWSEDLAWGLTAEEFALNCPRCDADLFIAMGAYGYFSTNEDYVTAKEREVAKLPLRPAAPAQLTALGRRLHTTALSDGQYELARLLTYAFGNATCPGCAADHSVADLVSAG